MPRPSGSSRKKPRVAAGAGAGADRITALPLELRAYIASFLPYEQIVQLSTLSRPWLHIHHHTPVVKVSLYGFVSFPGLLDEDAILGLRAALRRRAQEGGPKVDTLRLGYFADDRRMTRHADRIIALADARRVCVKTPLRGRGSLNAWALDLPPAARELEVEADGHLTPAIAGPGAASLQTLYLDDVVLREWPRLPSLRSLTLNNVTVEAAFAPGAWCPLLEDLYISDSRIRHAHVDIRLPLLKDLDMDNVDVRPHDDFFEPFGDITVDAPALEDLAVSCTVGCTVDYRSFTLRAPQLRYFGWCCQFVERVDINVGSVTAGTIEFTANAEIGHPEIKCYRTLMMRMLEELLPELSPEPVADAARPCMKLEKYTVEGFDSGEMIPEEKLTCDLGALMSSLKV
ncbi:hypothetical protein ACP70R_023322 [Stipagrostis hirtigluma subsp. patula]